MPDLVGKRLGQYEILQLIGQGGMATVYRARQESMDRDVALKEIREEAGPALEAMRALAEACTLPGIVRRNGSCSPEMFFDDPLTDP